MHLTTSKYAIYKLCSRTRSELLAKLRNDLQLNSVRVGLTTPSHDILATFPNSYDCGEVEPRWSEWWLQQGLFQSNIIPKDNQTEKKVFSMVLPPPNITGELHLGHALTNTIQDALVRWHRSKGFHTVWIPGYDHAGIATQVVVEKKIQAQTGRTRKNVSKEEFLREVHAWKEKKIESIRLQLQKLGSSLDWSRECFTMDEDYAMAVTEAFVRLHDKGLIKCEKALVNWCCHLQSAISDIEVNNLNVKANSFYHVPGYQKPIQVGKLFYFAYVIANSGNKEELVVASSRPETMLGDVALAIHPSDQRYSHYVNQYVIHPFDGRELPIIADDSVNPTFGTGCVKITPAHDHNDFEIAKRHHLPFCNILDEKGNITTEVNRFRGLPRFEARDAVVQELKLLSLFRKEEGHDMSLPVCSRSGDIIEPLLRSQWHMDCSEMFTLLSEDIQKGAFSIQPDASRTILLNWLAEKRKWCISRQLWWGHQIPAYRMCVNSSKINEDNEDSDDNWVVARSLDEAVIKASKKLRQKVSSDALKRDDDVLDTWFSSALFPFVAFGWPKETSELGAFYPLSLMETGHDIIFFWVARMAILGQKLTGKRPFSKVFVHSLVCDAHGRKMSKSLGNVIDPIDVIQGVSLQDLISRSEAFHRDGYINLDELDRAKKAIKRDFPNGIPKCGADALRFALLSQDLNSQYINLDVEYIHSCSKFCNKIWQACKFFLISVEKTGLQVATLDQVDSNLSPLDKWILSELYNLIKECNSNFKTFDLHLLTKALRHFWYSCLCDVYLEGIKPTLNEVNSASTKKTAALTTLFTCIRTATFALSPVMPFLTEELYHRLNLATAELGSNSIVVEPYPEHENWAMWHDPVLEVTFSHILSAAGILRQIKVDYGILKEKPKVLFGLENPALLPELQQFFVPLEALAKCKVDGFTEKSVVPNSISRKCNSEITVHVQLQGVVDTEEVLRRLHGRRQKLEKTLEQWNHKISSPKYEKYTFEETKHRHSETIKTLEEDLRQIQRNINEVALICTVN